MATFNQSITNGANDGVENQVGSVNLTGASFAIDGDNHYAAYHYTNVTIPPGSTITDAYLTLSSTSSDRAPNVTLQCEDVDTPSALAATTDNLSNRTLTTANTSWSTSGLGDPVNTPSFHTAVQEVIDRAGWASGNGLMVIIRGFAGSDYSPYFKDTSNYETPIVITYTPPAASGAHQKISTVRLSTKVGGLLT